MENSQRKHGIIMPFGQAAAAWLERLRRAGASNSTLDCYRRDLGAVASHMAMVSGRRPVIADLALFAQPEADAITARWLAQGASGATIMRRFAALRGFGRHLIEFEDVASARILTARTPVFTRNDEPAIDDDAVAELISPASYADDWFGGRDRAIALTMASGGLTTAETVNLDCRDILSDSGAVAVRSTVAPRLAAVSHDALAAVADYRQLVPFQLAPADALFVNRLGRRLSVRTVQVSFARRRAAAGLPERATPMGLRHSCARAWADSGKSPQQVAEQLGLGIHAASRYFSNARVGAPPSSARRTSGRRGRHPGPGPRTAAGPVRTKVCVDATGLRSLPAGSRRPPVQASQTRRRRMDP
jgi:integrase/recombinase XerC